MQRHRFGRRAETLPEDQLLLGLEEAEQIEAAGMEDAEQHSPAERLAKAAKRRAKRTALPPHLPGVEMVVDIEGSCLPVLPQRPASDWRRRERAALHFSGAAACACSASAQICVPHTCEDAVVQAQAPARLIEGGLATEATARPYADHVPLYRQAQIYARQGINLDRSTLADWVGRAAWHLRPVHKSGCLES